MSVWLQQGAIACLAYMLTHYAYLLLNRPQPFSRAHDGFLTNYATTGKSNRVLDAKLNLVAMTKVCKCLQGLGCLATTTQRALHGQAGILAWPKSCYRPHIGFEKLQTCVVSLVL